MAHFTNKIVMALAALSAAAIPTVSNAASIRYFTAVNNNYNYSIQTVWYAPSGVSGNWLATDMNAPISPRSSSRFTMAAGSRCFYDIRVQFSDDVVQTFTNINVCRGDRTISY